jgi:low affinity Fe/Cu permease
MTSPAGAEARQTDANEVGLLAGASLTPAQYRSFKDWHSRCSLAHMFSRDAFHWFAARVSAILGTPWSFLFAVGTILVWLATGPLFHFSDTWQLIVNTGTTVITFLMVFLIQNTQNRDAKAIHLKLDELIRTNRRARDELIDLELLSEGELDHIQQDFHRSRETKTNR